MELQAYFENTKGYGVLATADDSGKVDAALYARPHFMEDGTIAFIMADRLSHANLQHNPSAVYLFIESGEGYNGKRLYLTKTGEKEDDDLVTQICRRCNYTMYGSDLSRYVVFFSIDKELPLVGSGK